MPYKILITIVWLISGRRDWGHSRMPQTGARAWTAGQWQHRTGSFPVRLAPTDFAGATELPGKGCSLLLFNEMIYLTSPGDANDALLCYDSHGSEKWRTVFNKEDLESTATGRDAMRPCYGRRPCSSTQKRHIAAVDLDGKVRWKTDLVERFGRTRLFGTMALRPCCPIGTSLWHACNQGESWLAALTKKLAKLPGRSRVITRHRPNAITLMRRRWSFNTKGRSLS